MINERYMHVSRVFREKTYSPYISLKGKWLEEAGFSAGESIRIDVDYGRLTIKHDYKNKPNISEQVTAPQQSANNLEEIVEKSAQSQLKQPSIYHRTYRGYTVWLRMERDSNYKPRPLHSAEDVFRFLKSLQYESREIMLSIMLDTRNRVVGVYEADTGSVKFTKLPPFEILKSALAANSRSIILAHNHPSGDSKPSRDDLTTTKKLAKASQLMQIDILDHVIIGLDSYSSLKELGHL